jgi:uncharacterized membrane protein (Fun14 family)
LTSSIEFILSFRTLQTANSITCSEAPNSIRPEVPEDCEMIIGNEFIFWLFGRLALYERFSFRAYLELQKECLEYHKNLIVEFLNVSSRKRNVHVRTMSIPPEIAWIVPVVLPFIIGLLVGIVIKKGLKLLIAIAALIIVLIATGILSVSFTDVFSQAMKFLPKLYDAGQGWLNALPYSSITFIIGLVLGFLFG